MATQTKQCLKCHTLNHYAALNCADCGDFLPIADFAAPSGTQPTSSDSNTYAVRTPAFSAPITPTIHNPWRRVLFAVFAAPLIGAMIGGNVAWVGVILEMVGAPRGTGIFFGALGFISLTALVAYVILTDRVSLFDGSRSEDINQQTRDGQRRNDQQRPVEPR